MNALAISLQTYFTTFAHTQRDLSVNTIASYRDTWRMLLKYLTTTLGFPPTHSTSTPSPPRTSPGSSTTSNKNVATAAEPATPDSPRSAPCSAGPCPTIPSTPPPSPRS